MPNVELWTNFQKHKDEAFLSQLYYTNLEINYKF